MPDSTDTAGKSKGRVVVSIPAETKEGLDALGAKIGAAVEAASGVKVDISPAQVVQSLVATALAAAAADGKLAGK